MQPLFFLALSLLYYVYDGYLRVLQVASAFLPPATTSPTDDDPLPEVTVLVTAFNEEANIVNRLDNILHCDYPRELLSVLVASDGSTDDTDRLALEYGDERVRLYRSESHGGKTGAQNDAIATIERGIVVFTDADTRFERNALREIVRPFADDSVGGVTGRLLFETEEGNGISENQGRYWRYELELRRLESHLGILAVSTGAFLALRRELFRPMAGEYGEDCVVPLDVVLQGKKMVHATDAIAYDRMDNSAGREFRTRVRMTLRNWQGTWSRSELLNPIRRPGYAFGLWSHKLLRWLSPIFLIGVTVAALMLAAEGRPVFQIVSALLGLFYLGGMVGWMAERLKIRAPGVRFAYSFLLANIGFFVGLVKSLAGKRVTAYRHSANEVPRFRS